MKTITQPAPLQSEPIGPPPSSIVQFPTPRRRRRQVDLTQHRFKLQPFLNRAGSRSWRVSGTKRDGTRIRENFKDEKAAQHRQIELEAEFVAKHQDSALRATRLTDTQVKLAETAFAKLDNDDDILFAVDYWRKHGKQHAVAESPRLDDAVKAFTEWLDTTPMLRDQTKVNLRVRVKVFANSIGNVTVADIDPDIIEQYLDRREVSPASKDNDRRAISRFLRWCIERPRRWATVNPCREVRIEKGEKAPPAVLEVATCEKLMTEAQRFKEGRLTPYVAVTLFGGLRPYEASRLTWQQVNLNDNEIRLEANQTKTGRPRVVTIGPTLRAWLQAFKSKAFFPANWLRDFNSIKASIGYGQPTKEMPHLKPWPVDVLRHTAISHYFRDTGSYGRTAEQFGNSEAIIKAHYQGRVSSEDTKRFFALRPAAVKDAKGATKPTKAAKKVTAKPVEATA